MSRSAAAVVGRALKAFYDDQMTHHAAALTYYALMSLFPAVLLALALLGLIGQYPETYNAIFDYLRIWHNRQRRHSALGMLSPVQFEAQAPSTVA